MYKWFETNRNSLSRGWCDNQQHADLFDVIDGTSDFVSETIRYWYFFGMTSLLSADKLSNQMIFKAIISNWHVLDIFEQKAQKCMFEITTNLTYNITIEINIVTCLSPKWVLTPEVLIHNTFRFIVFYASECHTWTSSSILLVCYRIAIRLHSSRKTPNMDRILFIEQST